MPDLYPYQERAKNLVVDKKKVFLAMDVGTGKTCTSLLAMEELMEREEIQYPVLVVTLSSLKFQWEQEVYKFTDSMALVIDGTPKKRERLYKEILNAVQTPDYVIVNYETLVKDHAWYSTIRWGAIICDEVSALSNFRSKRTRLVKELSKRIPIRVGLSGTPLENGKAEALFSQFEFIDPDILGTFWEFENKHIIRNPKGWIVGYNRLDQLHRTVSPVTARARQDDPEVASCLPSVVEYPPTLVPWDKNSLGLYQQIAEDTLGVMDEAAEMFGGGWSGFDLGALYSGGQQFFDPKEMEMRGEIMLRITALRMLCDHPLVLLKSAEDHLKDEGKGSSYAAWLHQQGALDGLTKAPKLDAVRQYLLDFLSISQENKAVLFTQYLRMGDLLSDEMSGIGHVQFHGGMSATSKARAKTLFTHSADCRLFISTDAGGYGLNLQSANLLVNYDLPWTYGKKTQREGRIVRAGSRWPSVTLETFLMEGSLEMRQYQGLVWKQDVAGAILDNDVDLTTSGDVRSALPSLYESLSTLLETPGNGLDSGMVTR